MWATDITYIKTIKGFAYLVAIIDLFSRKILSWKLSNTLDLRFCIEARDEAIEKYGQPEIFNSDQGCQFTSHTFLKKFLEGGVRISMDGKGRALDNVFIERFWRSLKQESIYLHDRMQMKKLKVVVSEYMDFYNHERIHQSLNYLTPEEVYAKALEGEMNFEFSTIQIAA